MLKDEKIKKELARTRKMTVITLIGVYRVRGLKRKQIINVFGVRMVESQC